MFVCLGLFLCVDCGVRFVFCCKERGGFICVGKKERRATQRLSLSGENEMGFFNGQHSRRHGQDFGTANLNLPNSFVYLGRQEKNEKNIKCKHHAPF